MKKEMVSLINERKIKSKLFKLTQKHEYEIVEVLKDFYTNNLLLLSVSADYDILNLNDSGLFANINLIDLTIDPPQSIQIKLNLTEPSAMNLLLNSFGTFDLLHIDPPWSYFSDSPTPRYIVDTYWKADKVWSESSMDCKHGTRFIEAMAAAAGIQILGSHYLG
eukprot:snap_masked-scaffold_64-processed-gene-0.80-mRNA-1 protein AED:1.00 eAED:1.00 QI:0/0/0/0/1/1/3/0/163